MECSQKLSLAYLVPHFRNAHEQQGVRRLMFQAWTCLPGSSSRALHSVIFSFWIGFQSVHDDEKSLEESKLCESKMVCQRFTEAEMRKISAIEG